MRGMRTTAARAPCTPALSVTDVQTDSYAYTSLNLQIAANGAPYKRARLTQNGIRDDLSLRTAAKSRASWKQLYMRADIVLVSDIKLSLCDCRQEEGGGTGSPAAGSTPHQRFIAVNMVASS